LPATGGCGGYCEHRSIPRKAGRFELDRCLACGLVFQNPRLTDRGLEYDYGDFYDGIGASVSDQYYQLGAQIKRR
jgi:hypothetical protein